MRSSRTFALAAISAGALLAGVADARAGPCSQQIAEVTKQLAASDAGAGPTKGGPAPTAGEQKGAHPGTGLISKETEGKATSPEDVRRQSGIQAEAGKALERARKLDAEGKEAECMTEVRSAEQMAATGR
jgi:hypothetical protein